MTFFLFVVFGVIEQVSFFYLCCSLFRFKAEHYLPKYVIISLLIVIGNYFIRHEDLLIGLAPLFSLVMFIICIWVLLTEVSLLWAAIMGIVSYTLGGIMQSAIFYPCYFLGWTSPEQLQHHSLEGFAIQLLTAILVYSFSRYMYKRGLGFTFSVDRFKLAGENIIVLIILICFLTALGIIFFFNHLLMVPIVLGLPLLLLIYFAIRKQREDARNTSFLE